MIKNSISEFDKTQIQFTHTETKKPANLADLRVFEKFSRK